MPYDKRSSIAIGDTMFGVEAARHRNDYAGVLGTNELLTLLRERGVTNADVQRVLELPSSRVSELFGGRRRLQLEEAKKLVEYYGIDERVSPLSEPIARLLVLHGAQALGADVGEDDPRVTELAKDFRAFSQFASDPRVRENEIAVQAFFQGLRLAADRTGESPA